MFDNVWKRVAGALTYCIERGIEATDPVRYKLVMGCFNCLPILTLGEDGLPLAAETGKYRFSTLYALPNEHLLNAIRNLATITRRQHKLIRTTASGISHPAINNNPDHISHQDQILIKRATTYVHCGLLSKALSVVENRAARVLTPEECLQPTNLEAIRRLHPRHDDIRDALPPPEEVPDIPALQLELGDLVEGLKKLPRQSAPSMSGYTNELLKQILDDDLSAQHLILTLFNQILSGKIADPTFLQDSRLVMLVKDPVVQSLRPIAVGEVIYRFLGRLISLKIAGSLGRRLFPGQLGIGLSGTELASHTVSAMADLMNKWHYMEDGPEKAAHDANPHCVLALDAKNAFNSVGRDAIYKGVLQYQPNLLKFFMWAYGSHPPIYLSNGKRVCYSETGVRQGDPLGPIFFCLAIHNPLLRTIDKMNQLPDGSRGPLHGLLALFSYYDDITIGGPRSVCLETLEFLRVEFEPIGIVFADHKHQMWDPTIDEDYVDETTHMRYLRDGIIVVGVPHGLVDPHNPQVDDNYAAQKLKFLLEELSATLICVKRLLPINYAIPIIQCCLISRANYWMRNIKPELTNTVSREFDERIDTLLATYVGSLLSLVSKLVRSLPAVYGGAGLQAVNFVRKAAYISSFLLWASYAKNLAPKLFVAWTDEPGIVGEDSPIYRILSTVPHFEKINERGVYFGQRPRIGNNADGFETMHPGFYLQNDTPIDYAPVLTQHLLTVPLYKHRQEIILQTLPANSTQLAWFRSSSAPTTFNWAFSSVTTNTSIHLKQLAYQTNLRLRLLIPDRPPDQLPILITTCPNCPNPISPHDHYHFLSCTSNAVHWTHRHDELSANFCVFLKSILPANQIRTETQLRGTTDALYSDIRITNITSEVHLDVTIPNPGAISKRRALEDPEYSTKLAEDRKKKHYQHILGAEAASKVIIVAIDTTGHYGRGALQFLSDYTRQQHNGQVNPRIIASARKLLVQKNASTIAKWNSVMKTAWMTRMVQLPPEPAIAPEDREEYLASYQYRTVAPLPGPLSQVPDVDFQYSPQRSTLPSVAHGTVHENITAEDGDSEDF